jgi:hypothetical protein
MDIRNLIETKLAEFDSSLDISEGSDLQRNVIQPVVDALGVDPLSVDTRTFLVAKLTELFPDDVIARGSAVNDILIGAAQLFFEGYRRELSAVRNASSILNIDTLTDDDASGLAANWFVSRANGTKASGSVTVTLDSANSLSISPATTTFYTASGTRFVPVAATLYTTEQLLALQVGTRRYEAVINVVAVDRGAAGNVGAGTITRATGINNLVSVRNDNALAGGADRDTTQYLLSSKLPRAISERSLVTARGIGARLSGSITGLLRYQVIGMGDAEMTRDRVEVDVGGTPLLTGLLFTYGAYTLITGVPLGQDVQAGDIVVATQLDGSSSSVRVNRVLAQESTSPLYTTGATYIVELAEQSVGAQRVVVQRPASATLGETRVGSDVGLGGRTDVYIRSERTTNSSSVASLSRGALSGVAYTVSNGGYTVMLTDATLADEAELQVGATLLIRDEARVISRVRGNVLDINVPLSLSDGAYVTPWVVSDGLSYETAQGDVQVYPRAGGNLSASAPIGSFEVVLVGGDIVAAGVSAGDILSVPSAGLAAPITEVRELGLIRIDVPSPQTFAGASAVITRPASTGIAPLIGARVADIDYRHPLSLDVDYIDPATTVVTAGFGRALLPLGYALRAAVPLGTAETPFAQMPGQTFVRTFTSSAEGETEFNHVSAFSRGYRDAVPGISELIATTSGPDAGPVELPIYNDVFTADAHNVIALLGDTSDTTEDATYPAAGVERGDILAISSGPLTGRYLIESVLNLDLPADQSAAELNVAGNVRFARPPRVYGAPSPGQVQRVSIVRVYNALPTSGERVLAPEVRLATESIGDIKALTLESVLAYINAPHNLVRADAHADLAQQIVDAYAAQPTSVRLDSITPGDVTGVINALVDASSFDYTILRTSRSWATLRTLEGGDVCLAQPSVRRVDLEDIIKSPRPLHVKQEHPTLLHGPSGSLLVLDPDRLVPTIQEWDRTFALPSILSEEEALMYPEYESTQRTVIATSSSASDAPELNDPCTFVVRPEIEIVPAVSSIALNTRSIGYELFGIPQLADNFVGDVELITQTGSVIDSVSVQSQADVITALTDEGHIDAVDGAGTPMSVVVQGYAMFIRVPYGVDGRVSSVVAQVGRRVSVRAGAETTDEFTLGARMPHILYLPGTAETSGPALAVASVGETSDKLDFVPSWGAGSSTPPAPGTDVRIDYAGTRYWRRVVSREGQSIFLDTPLPFGTPPVTNYGICALDIDNKKIEITADPIYTGLSTEYVTSGIDVSTHMHLGGAYTVPDERDVGRQVTLWGLTHNELTLADMYPGVLAEDPGSQEELESSISLPTRRSIGQFTITGVNVTYANVGVLGERVAVRVTLELDAPNMSTLLDEISRETSYVRCSFAVTDVLLDIEEGAINNVLEVRAYERVATEFPVVGRAVYAEDRYVVQADSTDYYTEITRGDFSCHALTAFISTDNAYIKPHRLTMLGADERVRVSALRLPSALNRVSLSARGEPVYGYDVHQSDVRVAYSSEENLVISLPPASANALSSTTVSGRYDPAVAQTQALLSSALERAAASHSLAMSFRPCVLGLDVTYVGGASVSRARAALSDIIRESVISQGGISEALVVRTLTQVGATDVQTPITMYVCFADRTGRIVRRMISGALTEANLYDVDASLRTMYLEVPPNGEQLLGASINLTRVTSRINLIGTGGA